MAPTSSTRRCPTCRRPVEWTSNPSRPFCSQRCKLVDLGHWASERYRIAGEPVPDENAPEFEGGNGPTGQTP